MPASQLEITDGISYDSVFVDNLAINGASFTQAGYVEVSGRRGLMGVEIVASGGLAGLRVTRSVRVGGHTASEEVTVLEDADFNSVDSLLQQVVPATGAHTAAAAARIQFMIQVDGAAEIGIEVKGTGTADIRINLPI
jgi:hypothetical protein